MTTKQLEERVKILRTYPGVAQFNILFDGRWHFAMTHDLTLTDRINSDDAPSHKTCAGTYRQALQALYNEGLKFNRLGKYKN